MALHRQTINLLKTFTFALNRTEIRGIHRWVAPTLREIQRRKDKIGPLPPAPRSSYLEWNFDAELYAFSKRLGEEFKPDILQRALTHRTYYNLQKDKQDQGEIVDISAGENTELIKRGEEIISNYLKESFKSKFPNVIVKALHDHLMNEEILAHVGIHIGLKDIILTSEFPVEKSTIALTFKAIVGALEESADLKRAETFVNDILVAQLNGKEIFDIWEPAEPYNYLQTLPECESLEPRLCNESASNTILANYQVGIYSKKKLIGIGWGESVDIAKNTAALNAIEKIYNIKNNYII